MPKKKIFPELIVAAVGSLLNGVKDSVAGGNENNMAYQVGYLRQAILSHCDRLLIQAGSKQTAEEILKHCNDNIGGAE